MLAVSKRHAGVIDALLARRAALADEDFVAALGAALNAADRTGAHDAAAAALLARLGAAKLDNDAGTGLLDRAAALGKEEWVRLLLAHGAAANASPEYNEGNGTPLHTAAWRGEAAVVRRLLAAGAGPNRRLRGTGRTPLHYAAEAGHPDAVEALLAGGADPAARDRFDQTPADLAGRRARPDERILRALREPRPAGG